MNEQDSVNVAFKRRLKRGASRKRVRTAFAEGDEHESSGRILLNSVGKEALKRRKRKIWQREHYGVNEKLAIKKDQATAERGDVGGVSLTSTKKKKPYGPMQAPAHIRTSVRMDYQADVCKDYKETGYCGFGDACKFLHDRSDFTAGWKLDRDWAAAEKIRRDRASRGEDADEGSPEKNDSKEDDELPFACHICRKDFVQPVVTECGHYFCEECAVKRIQTDPSCPICKAFLDGTLNIPTKLLAKLKAREALLGTDE